MSDLKIHYRFDTLRDVFTPSTFVPATSYHYVLVRSLGEDYNSLKTIKYAELEQIKRSDTETQVMDLERLLYRYCGLLKERCLPIAGIEVTGTSGLIITSDKYKEILKDNIDTNLKKVAKSNFYSGEKISINASVGPIIRNLTTADVLPNYVPLELSFEPMYKYKTDNNDIVDFNPYKYTNIQRIESPKFEATVDLNAFIDLLNKDGYILNFNFGYKEYKSINNYDEYLEMVKKNPMTSSDNISMIIDFTDDNNVRR